MRRGEPRIPRAPSAEATTSGFRLLVDPPADGAWNMAVDEALLDSVVSDESGPPTLRLYGWKPPALSLGRFQPAEGSHDPHFLRDRGIDLVRRPTGGAAVLHEHERTYAVVARLRHDPFPRGVVDTYRRIALALTAAIRRLGLEASASAGQSRRDPGRVGEACFSLASAHEVSVSGRKLVGSAQLRRRGAFLQHGSILFRAEEARLARAVGSDGPASGFTDLTRELGRLPGAEEVDRALVDAFEATFGAELEPGKLTAHERERATLLRASKYLSARWTLEGRTVAPAD